MSKKISGVVLDGYTLNPGDLNWEPLEKVCDITIYEKTASDEVVERCKNCELVFTNKVKFTKDVIDALPMLKYIGVIATGYNVVDVEYAREKNITVTNVPSYSSDSVAELAFAFILEFCFQVGKHSAEVHAGKWSSSEHFCYHSFPLQELRSKTLGVFGAGHIGYEVIKIARSFGMNVVFSNRSEKSFPEFPDVKQVTPDVLFATSDFISLHAPLTNQTQEIINAATLTHFKKTAYLINTARGQLVNEQAVADALKAGRLAGYATDVLSSEPPCASNPLFGLYNCIITPHIAWQTTEARARLLNTLAQNAKAFLNGATLNRVN